VPWGGSRAARKTCTYITPPSRFAPIFLFIKNSLFDPKGCKLVPPLGPSTKMFCLCTSVLTCYPALLKKIFLISYCELTPSFNTRDHVTKYNPADIILFIALIQFRNIKLFVVRTCFELVTRQKNSDTRWLNYLRCIMNYDNKVTQVV
jgi:hypothetical protein